MVQPRRDKAEYEGITLEDYELGLNTTITHSKLSRVGLKLRYTIQ